MREEKQKCDSIDSTDRNVYVTFLAKIIGQVTIGPGEQSISFNIPAAAAGSYLLQVVINCKTYSTKVLKG
jgi:hypothetical protein